MGGGGSAPQPQSPQITAQQQTQSNVDTAVANATLSNTNQITPQGTLTYAQTGGQQVGNNFVPQYTATQTLSPEQQAIYDKTTGLQSSGLDAAKGVFQQLNNTVQKPLDFSGIPGLPTDQTALRNKAYDALTARSTTDLGRSRDAQQVQLANQGIAPGSEAYRRAMEGQDRAVVDASNQATINAGTIAGQDLSQAQTIRNQGINEAQTLRNQPFQEYSQLLGLGGNIQSPTYATPTQATVAPTDVAGIQANYQQQQMQAYQQQQQANNALMGGLFGLGGSVLGGAARNPSLFGLAGTAALGSDIRMKENIRHIGHTNDGQRLYSFNYIGDTQHQIGLMAQEVEKIRPDAVIEFEGLKYVDYAKALADA